MTSWRRLLVPVALSLVGHAAILFALGLIPREEPVAPPRGDDGSPLRLSMSISGPRRMAPKPVVPPGDWIDITPSIVIPETPSGGAGGPSLVPTVSGTEDGHGGGGAGGATHPAGSSVVVVPKDARRVVFLLDRSGSMAISDGLDRAKVELAAALEALPPETAFQILAYNSNALPLVNDPSGLVPASAENVARVRLELDALAASGFTRHVEAVRAALGLRPDLVILLTDADDLSPGDVHLMTVANGGRAAIDVVELTRDPLPRPDGGLASLAARNGGRHRRVVLDR